MKYLSKVLVILLFLSPLFLVQSVGNYDNISPLAESIDISSTSEVSWLSGWEYRKSHNITGSVGAGTNYQIQFIVNRGAGVDNGSSVYCGGQCRTDFGDIRFTSSDGLTLLDYWIESIQGSNIATFWVEVLDTLDVNQTIYIYYGNEDALVASDGNATFIFFDDFEGSSIDSTKWSIENPDGTATFSNSVLTLAGNDGDFRIALKSLVSAFKPVSIRFRGMLESTETVPQWNHIAWSHHIWGPGTYQRAGIRSKYGVNQTYVANDNGVIGDVNLSSQYFDTFHTFDVHRLTNSFELHSDDTFVTSGNNQPDDTSVPIVLYCRDDDYTLQCDWIFMRKIIDNEPTHGEWGELEDEPLNGLNWLSGWEFRKRHLIDGSTGAGRNYQIKIVVNYGTGADSSNMVFCNEYSRPDFGDIRFTDNDGIDELDYWMEVSHESENATFWVEVYDYLDYDQEIYVYFGNPDATSTSDGVETFIFFDDFENDDFNRWNTSDSAWSTQSSVVKHGSYAARGNAQTSNRWTRAILDSLITTSVMFHSWVRVESTFNYKYPLIAYEGLFNPIDDAEGLAYVGYVHEDDWATYNGTAQYYEMDTVSTNTWYEYEVAVDFTNDLYRPFIDGINKTTQELDIENGSSLSQIKTAAMVTCAVAGDHDQWQDDFYIRRYVHSEPAHGAWRILETAFSISSAYINTIEGGTTGNTVLWSALSYHPTRYLRFFDGTLVANSTWDGFDVEVSSDGLDLGSYNYTLQIFNIFGNTRVRSTTVRVVDTTDPILTHPDDINYTVGSQGNTIQWNLTDLYPDYYEINLGNVTIQSGTWNSTEHLSIDIDNLPIGEYEFTMFANDTSNNIVFDTVIVGVGELTASDMTIIIMIVGVVVIVIIGGIVCRKKKT
ncbi:MAG: DUF2341 domain-containing protein [Candidatus Thorarchaeota archaeon]